MSGPTCDHTDRLVHEPNGPFYGQLAHGFACGAHLAVHNGYPWNSLNGSDPDRESARAVLSRTWSVTDSAGWEQSMQHLLAGHNIGGDGEAIMAVRMMARQQWGVETVTTSQWLDCIAQWCRANGADADTEAHGRAIAQRVGRYESRFRADDLIPPEGFVTSMLAYDYGRAVNMARWGFVAEYCDQSTAERCVLAVSTAARARFVSWHDFSASYILGRVIRFDGDGYMSYYKRVLDGHRVLTTQSDSPWLHLQF